MRLVGKIESQRCGPFGYFCLTLNGRLGVKIANPPGVSMWGEITRYADSGIEVDVLADTNETGEYIINSIQQHESLPERCCRHCIYFGSTGNGVVCGAFREPDVLGTQDRADCVDWEDKQAETTVKAKPLSVRIVSPYWESIQGQTAQWLSFDEAAAITERLSSDSGLRWVDATRFGDTNSRYYLAEAEIEGERLTTTEVQLRRDSVRYNFSRLREVAANLDQHFRESYNFREGITVSALLPLVPGLDREGHHIGDTVRVPNARHWFSRREYIEIEKVRDGWGSAWRYSDTLLFFPHNSRRAPLHQLPRLMPDGWRPPNYQHDITATELLVLSLQLGSAIHGRISIFPRPFRANLDERYPQVVRFDAVEMEGHRLWSCTGRVVCE